MRILAIADEVSPYFYDFYTPGRLAEFDLILSCGDLPKQYLEFLVTMARCPLLYVPGNHDESYVTAPPEGCHCVDGKLHVQNGLRILGLGGAYRYREGPYLYTERQMARRVRRLKGAIRRAEGFDLLLTHAPARGLNDMDTMSHRGFQCFRELLEEYRPAHFLHGHIHQNYGVNVPRITTFGETEVINACGHYAFTISDKEA